MRLLSSDIGHGQFIRNKFMAKKEFGFGCDGENIAPRFSWSDIPEDTAEFAFTVFDQDAPTGCGFWHWIVVNIDKSAQALTEDVINNSLVVRNDYGSYDYGGPCPPEGSTHRYLFTLYSLQHKVEATKDTPAAQIGFQLNSKQLTKVSIMGLFGR